MPIGTNLDGLAYWSPALPMLDLVKSSGTWLPQNDTRYDTGEPVALDAHGWVKTLPDAAHPARFVRVNLNILHDNPAAPAAARYVVLYAGRGRIQVPGTDGARVIAARPGRILVRAGDGGSLYLQLTGIDAADPVRDIRVVREDMLPAYDAGERFNPIFVARIKPFRVLRFMDWMNTNILFDRAGKPVDPARIDLAPQLTWADRARPGDMRWGEGSRGVPVELLVDLANRTGAEPWFNMPVNASDDYVRGFAAYVHGALRPGRAIHVELSNEVWNWSFPQARYAAAHARTDLGRDAKWMEWYGKRSAEIGTIWRRVFGEGTGATRTAGRIRLVYNTQFGWQGLEDLGLDTAHWRDAAGKHVRAADFFDEYAITGYYDGTMNTDAAAPAVIGWWRDRDGGYARAIAVLAARIRTFNAPYYAYHAARARANGLTLVTYESGFGESTPMSQHGNQAYTDFLGRLQRRPEIHDLEQANYRAFKAAGGSLYMNFGIISTPGKWGSWSALETVTQATSPRYRALTDWIAANGGGPRGGQPNAG